MSAGPKSSGDLAKCRANRETCSTYDRWVFGSRLRIRISSIMRWRSGVMGSSCARWGAREGAIHGPADGAVRRTERILSQKSRRSLQYRAEMFLDSWDLFMRGDEI